MAKRLPGSSGRKVVKGATLPVCLLLLLNGCESNCAILLDCGGSREARPVTVTQDNDELLTCDEIAEELKHNETEIAAKRDETRKARDQRAINQAWGGTVAYNSSESGNAAEEEAWALDKRNDRLRQLGWKKGCA
jgi:hypothetical protein